MKVDLLVVSYNTPDKLQRLIETLHSDYEPDVWTLHITENGSPAATATANAVFKLGLEKGYKINSFQINNNIGYARAINEMAAKTDSEILCAVNADTWFTTKHVKDMIAMFEEHSNIAIAGPKQVNEDNIIRHGGIFWNGREGNGPPQHRFWNTHDPNDQLGKDLVRCWTVSGSIYYIRRSVWNKVANWPEYREYFKTEPHPPGFLPTKMYFEETFCSVAAQHLGYEVWYNGLAETAGHSWHASAPVGQPSRNWFQESQRTYQNICNALGIEHEIGVNYDIHRAKA